MKVKTRHTWKNSVKHLVAQPLKYFLPETLDDLVQIIQEAESNGFKVRAVGSGHSFSDVAITSDYMISTHELKGFLPVDHEILKDTARNLNLVKVLAGTSVEEFNLALDGVDKAIINMGGIDHQTIAGAVSTGTHGSGITLPALPGMIKAVTMVVTGGEIHRIEPTDGITDPAKYNAPKIKLIQDDDIFYSIVVGLGAMGVVYSYTVEVRNMYWIREERVLSDWQTLKKQILDGTIHNGNDGKPLRAVMVRINPYKVKKNTDRTVLLIRHTEISDEPRGRSLTEATRPIFFSVIGAIPGTPALATAWLQLFPKKIPDSVESGMRSMADKAYVNRAHRVLFLGQVRAKEHGMDSEFAYDAHQPQKIVDVIEAMFDKADKIAKTSNLYHTSQIGLRWVKASNHYLCPDYGMDVCYIDTPNHARTKGSFEILEHYQDVQFAMGGKPHWGKLHNRITSGYINAVHSWYPKLETWKKVFRQYNPKGTFRNNFTDRLKLDQQDNV
ncbi:MAG: FAD-binding protein [Flavobacteriales bacterium]|nr:FAD-binding protein [Flavobacteriales bacterium]